MTRVAPAVTIETTEELETTIKRRIQDQLWDDPVRKLSTDEARSKKRSGESALSRKKAEKVLAISTRRSI